MMSIFFCVALDIIIYPAALTKQGRLQSVAHSRCTMQRHQRLTTRIGATPKARMLWLLAKSFARCKTNKASNAKHPFLTTIEVFRQSESPYSLAVWGLLDSILNSQISQCYILLVNIITVSFFTAAQNFGNMLTALIIKLIFIVNNMSASERKSVIGVIAL